MCKCIVYIYLSSYHFILVSNGGMQSVSVDVFVFCVIFGNISSSSSLRSFTESCATISSRVSPFRIYLT